MGPVFLTLLGVGLTIEIVLALLTPLDFGPSFLMGLVAVVIGAALIGAHQVPQLSFFSAGGVQTLESWVEALSGAQAAFKSSTLYATLSALGALSSGIATLVGVELLLGVSGNWNVAGAFVLFAASLAALLFDVSGLTNGSPGLILLSLALSCIGVSAATKLLSGSGGTLSGYVSVISISGGFSAAIDVAKIVA